MQLNMVRNRLSSLIGEIHEQNPMNTLLRRFSLDSFSVVNRITDPLHILSLYVFDSTSSRRFIP